MVENQRNWSGFYYLALISNHLKWKENFILKLKKCSNSGQNKWFESSLVFQKVQFGHFFPSCFYDFTQLQFQHKENSVRPKVDCPKVEILNHSSFELAKVHVSSLEQFLSTPHQILFMCRVLNTFEKKSRWSSLGTSLGTSRPLKRCSLNQDSILLKRTLLDHRFSGNCMNTIVQS